MTGLLQSLNTKHARHIYSMRLDSNVSPPQVVMFINKQAWHSHSRQQYFQNMPWVRVQLVPPFHPKFTAETYSAMGCKKSNQDRTLLQSTFFYDLNTMISAYVVMDGHAGSQTSDFIQKWFMPCWSSYWYGETKSSDMEHITKQTLSDLEKEHERHSTDSSVGSTCCGIILQDDRQYTVWNVGDSQIVCADTNGECHSLVSVHRLSNAEEQKRIMSSFTSSSSSSSSTNVPLSTVPMTRSLGDRAWKLEHPNIMTSEPEIKSSLLPIGFRLALGTDGLFDVYYNNAMFTNTWNKYSIAIDSCLSKSSSSSPLLYQIDKQYKLHDIVEYEQVFYICLEESTTSRNPKTDNGYWKTIVSKADCNIFLLSRSKEALLCRLIVKHTNQVLKSHDNVTIVCVS
jgi:serine/threonine protein phosphatase PrpC